MADPITLPPELPTRKQAGFSDKFSAWLIWFVGTFIPQLIAVIKAFNFNSTTATSTTSNSIGPVGSQKTFVVDTEKSFQPSMFIVIGDAIAPTANSMTAQIDSYDGETGELVCTITGTLGSGTKTSWNVSQTANPIPLGGSVSHSSLSSGLISGLTAEASPAIDDLVMISDTSADGLRGMLLSNLLKVINLLAEDASPDPGTDFLLAYDTSAAAVKKILVGKASSWTYGSLVATTSGDPIVVLGSLPSWVTEIELILESVSLSGTDTSLIQIATGAAYNGTTYQSNSNYITTTVSPTTSTDGLVIFSAVAANSVSGVFRFVKGNGDVWRGTFIGDVSNGAVVISSGKATLAGAIGQFRIASSGSNTYDGGSIIGRYR